MTPQLTNEILQKSANKGFFQVVENWALVQEKYSGSGLPCASNFARSSLFVCKDEVTASNHTSPLCSNKTNLHGSLPRPRGAHKSEIAPRPRCTGTACSEQPVARHHTPPLCHFKSSKMKCPFTLFQAQALFPGGCGGLAPCKRNRRGVRLAAALNNNCTLIRLQ